MMNQLHRMNHKQKICKKKENKVFLLGKVIYGLKQGSHYWNITLWKTLNDLGFTQIKTNHCLHIKISENNTCIIAIYAHDLLVFSNNEKNRNMTFKYLNDKFKTKNLGNPEHYLGLTIKKDKLK